MTDLPESLIKAYKKTVKHTEKLHSKTGWDNQGMPVRNYLPQERSAATRTEIALGREIKKHYPNASLDEEVDIRRKLHGLKEHELEYWKKK